MAVVKLFLRRPVPWIAVIMSYVGIFLAGGLSVAQVSGEGHARERDLCGVVIAINTNAKFRADQEQRRLDKTLEFLAASEAEPPKTPEGRTLVRFVKQGLPQLQLDVSIAKRNEKATRSPDICKRYDERIK